MTRPTPHVKHHAQRAREHMKKTRDHVEEIQQLADSYIADQQAQQAVPAEPTPTPEVTPSQPQQTESTTASS